MKTLIGFLLALASLVVVLAVVEWERTELTSPGPLHGAHRVVDELQGSAGCANCHSDAGRDLASACVVCHEAIGEQLDATRGLHGQLEAGLVRDCGHCHIEHVGDEVSLVGDHAFERAGIEERDAYDHAHL
ncbi:MAG: hypothetical protein KDB80_11845, partial [Planctomycetes bacterium]|nr:hypothetical protein [Planctomycetota bacterium]